MRIFAAWLLHGVPYAATFHRWEDYFAATFNPDCEIQLVEVIK